MADPKRDALVNDADPTGLMDAVLQGKAFNVDEMVDALAGMPGAQEVVEPGGDEDEGGSPEPAGEPEADEAPAGEPEADEAPEPDEGSEDSEGSEVEARRSAEPDWIKQLPAEAQAAARKLHQTTEGQRRALKREGDRRRASEIERRQAIEIAVQLRKSMQGGKQPGSPEEAAEEAVEEFLEGEIDSAGNARIPVAKLTELIRREAQKLNQGADQQQQQVVETQRFARELLSEAGVTEATMSRMNGAVQFVMGELRRVAREEGRRPANPIEQRQMLRDAGVDTELARRFGGMRLLDVYQVYDGATRPAEFGDQLVELGTRFQSSWTKNGNGNGRMPEKSRIPEHPTSMGRKGAGLPARRAPGESAKDDLANMSMDDAIKATRDPLYLAKKMERWEEELRSEGALR